MVWGVLHHFKGELFPLCWNIDLQLNVGENNEKINQEELTVIFYIFYVLMTVSLRFKASPRAQRRKRQ